MKEVNVSKYVTEPKQLITGIKRAKKELISYAEKNGVYENFGVEYVNALRDRYIDGSDYSEYMNMKKNDLKRFADWCANYTGKEEIK